MIEFQDAKLEYQVYQLIVKMCDLLESDEFPHFVTTKLEDGRWKCELEIPGIKMPAVAYQDTEVEAINRCASNMLFIFDKYHKHGEYDPKDDDIDSAFRDKIEIYFPHPKYDPQYFYYPHFTDIYVNENDEYAKKVFKTYAYNTIKLIEEDGGEIDDISPFVSIKFLVKKRKKNYA